MKLAPQLIVDVGCGLGAHLSHLQTIYPEATVVGVDHSAAMLNAKPQAANKIHADAANLPFADHSVDIIFSNFVLPWLAEPAAVLKQWQRVLKPGGILLLTSLGLDCLRELPPVKTIPGLIDMHDLGDMLVKQGFAEPVMDVDYYTVNYQNKLQAIKELQALNMLDDEQRLDAWLSNQAGKWQVSYEIIVGHCWQAAISNAVRLDEAGTAAFPLAQLREQLRRGR